MVGSSIKVSGSDNRQWSCARRVAARSWVVGNENHLIKNLKFYKSGVGAMWECACAMLQ